MVLVGGGVLLGLVVGDLAGQADLDEVDARRLEAEQAVEVGRGHGVAVQRVGPALQPLVDVVQVAERVAAHLEEDVVLLDADVDVEALLGHALDAADEAVDDVGGAGHRLFEHEAAGVRGQPRDLGRDQRRGQPPEVGQPVAGEDEGARGAERVVGLDGGQGVGQRLLVGLGRSPVQLGGQEKVEDGAEPGGDVAGAVVERLGGRQERADVELDVRGRRGGQHRPDRPDCELLEQGHLGGQHAGGARLEHRPAADRPSEDAIPQRHIPTS